MTQRRRDIPPPPPPVLIGHNGGCGGMVSIMLIGLLVGLWYRLPF